MSPETDIGPEPAGRRSSVSPPSALVTAAAPSATRADGYPSAASEKELPALLAAALPPGGVQVDGSGGGEVVESV